VSLMSPRALATIRRTTELWMVDVVELWRGTTSDYDDATLIESPVAGTKLYDGKARIRPTSGPREQAVAEGVIVMRDAEILFPIDAPLPRIDDELRVQSSPDDALVGTWFRITDVTVFSQQASRRCSAIQAQPSRDWPVDKDV
jgi:hypothetical protein